MVTVIGATSGRTAPVVLGEACDVTNDCTLLPGTTVGKNACLGVFTYGAPDQHFDDYSITLGSFKLRWGCGLLAGASLLLWHWHLTRASTVGLHCRCTCGCLLVGQLQYAYSAAVFSTSDCACVIQHLNEYFVAPGMT
jgi:hypothetical protein